jgi:hypothetical protein
MKKRAFEHLGVRACSVPKADQPLIPKIARFCAHHQPLIIDIVTPSGRFCDIRLRRFAWAERISRWKRTPALSSAADRLKTTTRLRQILKLKPSTT